METVGVLKRFYFSESADWMAILIDKLFDYVTNGGSLNSRVAQSIFEASLLDSAYADLPARSDIHMSLHFDLEKEERWLNDISTQHFISQSNLDTRIAWPMSLVITQESLDAYSSVFRTLLRVNQARWWVDHIWQIFNKTKKFQIPQDIKTRVKLIRLWYQVNRICASQKLSCVVQDAVNLVTMLQGYMHHEINQSQWEVLQRRMQQQGLSFAKIKDAHDMFLQATLEACFQTSTTRRLKSVGVNLSLALR